jgi:protein-S-isoprenylcysteine O-methyltransferase Ste14
LRRSPNAAGAFTPIAVVFLLGLIGGVLASVYFPILIWPSPWFGLAGLLPLTLGAWLFVWARATFRRHRTPLMPWRTTSSLVTDGPFHRSRNPIYLSFAMVYLGLGVLLDSPYILVMLVVVVVLFDRFQIPREEEYLRSMFGAAFDSYAAEVRRWF